MLLCLLRTSLVMLSCVAVSLQSIRELQNSVRDGVILFKALLDELRKNMETEKHNINTLSENLQETVRRTHDVLMREVDG